jgi:hypothetical protein
MPLIKGAKPGTKAFGRNIAAEIRAGKPPAQAAAIAYSEAKKDPAAGSPPISGSYHRHEPGLGRTYNRGKR